mgnify:FL=1
MPQVLEWTGELAFAATTIIELPSESLAIGSHTLIVSIVNPNGEEDIDMSNNSAEVTFEIANGQVVTVEINTDEYGNETAFILFDENENIIAEEYTFLNNANHTFSYCLQNACYYFLIFDEYGDGIFPPNGYNVYDENGESLIIPNEGMFETEEHEICLESNSEPLVAAFESDFNQLCESGIVNFEATTPIATRYCLNFECGTTITSTEMNPTVDYPNIGNYNVTLIVSNGSEQNEIMIENYVQVTNPMALVSVDVENISSTDATDGSVDIDITSGNPPFVYEWSTGQTTTDDGTLQNLSIGTYSVEVTDESNCTLSIDFEIEIPNGIETNGLSNNISIFPNPTTDKLYISFEENTQNLTYKIDILNVAGQVLDTKTTYNHTFFDVANLASGVYFIRFADEKNSHVTKFVRE